MRAKFEKRANKLQDDCLQALSDNRNKFAEKIDGFGYCTGYYLSENHNYDAFVSHMASGTSSKVSICILFMHYLLMCCAAMLIM